MNNVLYLTPTERKLFDALNSDLKEGWEVEEEKLTSVEDPEDLPNEGSTTICT